MTLIQPSADAAHRTDKRPLVRQPLSKAELGQSPLHDFPIRDEVLYQYLEWDPALDILEIGPGSGFTAFWLSRQVRHMTLLDAAQQTIDNLREELVERKNLGYECADAGALGLPEMLHRQFDAIYGLDVFEYIPDPGRCIQNLGNCLRPGGQLLLSFPNVPPPKGDGVTWFTTKEEAETLLRAAGFKRHEIFTIRLRPYAAVVYDILHEKPLAIFRKLRAGNGNKDDRPQIYEATWAFKHRGRMNRYKPLLHAYWNLLNWCLRLRGDVFLPESGTETILGHRLIIRAWK